MTQKSGKVFIIGAGPGDANYLTVRSHYLLTQAEVLVYDALVNQDLLKLAPANCEKIYVGKRAGELNISQSDIDTLLVEKCQLGKQIVRLKSGDPFIFGRTASEIQALKSAGCDWEVSPGISSALAAPLLAGIPLTDPVISRCFAVLTAHDLESLNWEALVQLDTLVILMGARRLSDIVEHLIRHGRDAKTPIAIIHSSSSPQEAIWLGDLGNIVAKTEGISLSPAVLVIGEVVGMREYLNNPNLIVDSGLKRLNKTILVTRAAGQSGQFTDLLTAQGARVIEMPTLEIGPPSSWVELDQALGKLSTFDWLILTSSNGVDYFFDRLLTLRQDSRVLAQTKIAVVGKKTAESLNNRGLLPDFIPPNFIADSLVENFPEKLAGKRILFPRVETGGREVLVKELSAQGAEVIEVPGYQSGCPEMISQTAWESLKNREIDVITFASSKTVKHFCQLLEKEYIKTFTVNNWPSLLTGVMIASIGPETSKTCYNLLGRVDIEAKEYTLEGLTDAIMEHT